MELITLDFETYYTKQYSLSKMTTQAYINDLNFETIGVAVKRNSEPAKWFSGSHEDIKLWLGKIDWDNAVLVAHNAMFDASILSFIFDIHPKKIVDTLSMARALHGVQVGGSLAALAKHYQIGEKGTEVLDALGKRRKNFTKDALAKYGAYCVNDVDLTYEIFLRMQGAFDKTEASLIDMTIKMHTNPAFELDIVALDAHLVYVRGVRDKLIDEVVDMVAAERMCSRDEVVKEDVKKQIMSNPKFALLLERYGVEPPMKTSPTTGKLTYAFAKSDEDFKALQEHESIEIQTLLAARLGLKSTLEETRTQRFLTIADTLGTLPVPLKYYGAMTGRWAASDSINLQNLPRKSKLKEAITAPLGYVIVGADLSNIELRVGLYFADQQDKLQLLGDGLDLYKDFAAGAFKVAYDQVTDEERFVGKTACIAEGELVLTEKGLTPIEKIAIDDKVWDGVEWVQHDGLIYQGEKNVIEYQGLRATSDHIVYLEDGTTCEFGDASNKRARIANTGNARSAVELLDNNKHGDKEELQERVHAARSVLRLWGNKVVASRLFHSGLVEELPVLCVKAHTQTPGASARRGQVNRTAAEKGQRNASTLREPAGQGLQKLWCTRDRVPFFLHRRMRDLYKGFARLFSEFICRSYRQSWALCPGESALYYRQNTSSKSSQHVLCRMERAADSGKRVERKSLRTNVHNTQIRKEGYDRRRNNSEGMGVSGQKMQGMERATEKVRVYDLLNAGPRHRFTVSGVLVSNCLSLIYGTGAKKLRAQCKMLSGKDIGEGFAQEVVDLYRTDYANVKGSWADAEELLNFMYAYKSKDGLADIDFGKGTLSLPVYSRRGIKLPSGLFLSYPDLLKIKGEFTYKSRGTSRARIHGPKMFQNTIQALARCVMGEAMVRIHKRYPVALTIHDACYLVVPEADADTALKFVIQELKREPAWAPGIPLDAEGGYGANLSFKMGKVKM